MIVVRALVLAAALTLLAGADASGRQAVSSAAPGKANVWFAPLAPDPPQYNPPYIGSADFMKLFSPTAQWKKAAKQITVFKLYGGWVARAATGAQLRRIVADLRRRGISIAVEAGPLEASPECGQFIEGFAGIEEGLHIARRIKDAGGVISYFSLDEPFFYGSIYQGERACRWSAERVAQDVARWTRGVRRIFPKVKVGDIEPVTRRSDVERYKEWVDTYRRVTGQRLAFLHLDMGYYNLDWTSMAHELEGFARSRGVPFGMIYFGEPSDPSDAAWLARAQTRFETYETVGGGRPDHAVLQSWQDRPDFVLPEANPARYTSLINRYARPRPRMTLSVGAPAADSSRQVSGRLVDARGRPLRGAALEIAVTPRYENATFPAPRLRELVARTDATGTYRAALTGLPAIGVAVETRFAGSKALWPAYAAVAIGSAGRNVALGRPVSASASLPERPPPLAVNGVLDDQWISGVDAPQWIEVDLGGPTAIGQIRLVVEQFPAGQTHHVVLGRGNDGALRILHEFRSRTDMAQVLELTPTQPWTDIRALRIETLSSPSWPAWREIEAWSW